MQNTSAQLAVPVAARAELDRLRTAFPDFSFAVSRGWRGPVFEAWRDPAADGLYAVITQDARELWRELEACQNRWQAASYRCSCGFATDDDNEFGQHLDATEEIEPEHFEVLAGWTFGQVRQCQEAETKTSI